MSRPRRVQQERVSGFKLPANTRSVARPSRFGNAFKIGKLSRAQAVENHRASVLKRLKRDPDYLEDLRGWNLACFCWLNEPCHADTLLELANRPKRVT